MILFKVIFLTCMYWTTANAALIYLGSVEGTGIFHDQPDRSWEMAKKTCEDAGLQMMTIDTKAKVDFLKTAYSPINFFVMCWTGGRDSLKLSRFSWDNNGMDLSSDLVEVFESFIRIETALAFQATPDMTSVQLIPASIRNGYGALCQTK